MSVAQDTSLPLFVWILSLTAVLALVSFLSGYETLLLFIVLGQAHFLITYLYQSKAGVVTKKYMLGYGVTLACLFFFSLFVLNIEHVILLAGFVFLIHFLADEALMAHTSFGRNILLPAGAFGLLYMAVLTDALFQTALMFPAVFLSALLWIFHSRLQRTHETTRFDWLLLFGTLLLSGIALFDVTIPAEKILGSIILLHYTNWYVFYFLKTKKHSLAKMRGYLVSAFLINTFVILLYAVYTRTDAFDGVLQFLFLPLYFYIWTIMHIVFSGWTLEKLSDAIKPLHSIFLQKR